MILASWEFLESKASLVKEEKWGWKGIVGHLVQTEPRETKESKAWMERKEKKALKD